MLRYHEFFRRFLNTSASGESVSTIASRLSTKESRLAVSARVMLKRLEAAPSPETRHELMLSRMGLMNNRNFWKPLIQTLQKKAKNKFLCIEVFDWMRREVPDVNKSQIYANMIAYAGSLRKPQLAHDWLSEMRGKGIKMSTSTYNALVSVLCKNGEIEAAVEMIGSMKREADCPPNILTYNTILAAYGRSQRVAQMEQWLEEIQRAGLTANLVTYNTLLFSYFKKGKLQKVEETYEGMKAAGCEPDVFTFGILLHGYEKANMLEKIESVFADRRKSGFSLSAIAALRMIQAYSRSGKIERLKKLLDELPRYVYTTQVNSAIVEAFIGAGDAGAAEEQMQRIIKREKAFLEPETLHKFIDTVTSIERLHELYRNIRGVARWALSSQTYELLIRRFSEAEELAKVEEVSSDMYKAGRSWSLNTMELLYRVFKRTGNKKGLEIILEKMQSL